MSVAARLPREGFLLGPDYVVAVVSSTVLPCPEPVLHRGARRRAPGRDGPRADAAPRARRGRATPPTATIALTSRGPLATRIVTFRVDDRAAAAACPLAERPCPDQAAVALVVRGDELYAGRGVLQLLPGDHVSVVCRPEDEPALTRWFGQRIDDD